MNTTEKSLFKSRRFRIMLGLLIPATLLAVLAGFSETYREKQTGLIRSALSLPDFKTEDIRKIEFRFGAMPPLQLVLQNGNWIVRAENKPEIYANSRKIAELISDLKRARLLRELYIQDEAAADSLALSDYKEGKTVLDPETKRPRLYYGAEVKIFGADQKILLDMMCGNAHYRPMEMVAENVSMQSPDGRYIRIIRNGKKSCYLISRIFEECIPMSGLWVEQLRLNAMDEPVSIRYTAKDTAVWEMKLAPDGKQYFLSVPDKTLNQRSIAQKLQLLSGAFTRDIANTGTDFKPDSALILELKNGFTYTIRFQDDPRNEMRRFGQLDISFDPEKVRQKPGESPENLEKRKKFLAQEAEVEKHWFGGKTYILQPNVINIIREVPGQ